MEYLASPRRRAELGFLQQRLPSGAHTEFGLADFLTRPAAF
jgi:hypothetical protein